MPILKVLLMSLGKVSRYLDDYYYNVWKYLYAQITFVCSFTVTNFVFK